jgi:hypothetical protein
MPDTPDLERRIASLEANVADHEQQIGRFAAHIDAITAAGLDVERLARVMEEHAWDIDCGGHCAPQIAREYAVLAILRGEQ